LDFNKTEDLTLYGGQIETVELNTLHLGEHTRRVCLKNLTSYKVDRVLESLPTNLTSFEVLVCDQYTKESLEITV
jgi:hypothetical protein